MATIFLLLLLLPAIKAFSIHQLLILSFVEVPRLCYSANLAYKQFMQVLILDSSGFVKLAFFVGQYSYGYAVPKNSD
jgi:hypothetical protein